MCLSSAERAADRNVTTANSTQHPVLGTLCPTFRKELGIEYRLLGTLIQRINRESAEQLREEIGGLLRQHFADEGNIADLIHAYRIHQERRLHLATLHLRQRIGGFATIRNVVLIPNRLFRNLQDAFQYALMQLHHVERLLAQGKLPE